MAIVSLPTADGKSPSLVGKVRAGILNVPLWSQTDRYGIVTGLALLTGLPRLLLAWHSSLICDDGYYYLSVARMWSVGQTQAALSYLNLNLYPLILWGLKSAGLPSPWNYKLWGLGISCLTVFPLFALVRRLFDERTALIAVVLFAIHPDLIELSVEPIREATFWFFFLTASYLLHRCATSRSSVAVPVAAGIAMACAILTRSEGWALMLLVVTWPLVLAPTVVTRQRQFQRIATVVVMVPVAIMLLNLTVLQNHPQWEWGRFDRLPKFFVWVQHHAFPTNASPTSSSMTSPPVVEATHITSVRDDAPHAHWSMFVRQFCESFGYLNAFLWGVCLTQSRDRFRMPLHGPVLAMAGVMLLAVGILFMQHGDINGRYFLTPLIITLPFQALGVNDLLHYVDAATSRLSIGRRTRTTATAFVALIVALLFWQEALTGRHASRAAQAKLGKFLRSSYGPFQNVETDWRSGRIGYHAVGKLPMIIYNRFQKPLRKPDLVITGMPVPRSFHNRIQSYGLQEVSLPETRHLNFTAFVSSGQSHDNDLRSPDAAETPPDGNPGQSRSHSGPPLAGLPPGFH